MFYIGGIKQLKIKNDFITNSSSTSFIIKHHPTGIVLKEMWNIFINDLESDNPNRKIDSYLVKAEHWINNNYKNFNNNVIIPWTCNYETFIFHNKNDVEVHTCNNMNWSFIPMKLDYVDYNNPINTIDMSSLQFLDLSDLKFKSYNKFIKDRRKLYKNY